MPEVYSMSRWNQEDEYGDKPMLGDRYVHSIRKSKAKKPRVARQRGCEKNNHGPHLYAGYKNIVEYEGTGRTSITVTSRCLFCNKFGKVYSSWKSTPNPPASLEILRTDVRLVGRYIHGDGKVAGHFTYDKSFSYDGETDKNGKKVVRY